MSNELESQIRQTQVEYLAEIISRLEDNMINPREFGKLEAEVQSLRNQVDELQRDMRTLLDLASRSKGGLWTGMTLASVFGGMLSWIINQWVR